MYGLLRLEWAGQHRLQEAVADAQAWNLKEEVRGSDEGRFWERVLPGPFFGLGLSLAICRDNLFWET